MGRDKRGRGEELTADLRPQTSGTTIAEGCGHRSKHELSRFADVAVASLSEVQYQLILARDLKLIHPRVHAELEDRVTEVRRMLTAFASSVRSQGERPTIGRTPPGRNANSQD